MHFKQLGLVTALLMAYPALAQVSIVSEDGNAVILNVTEHYVMGDNDTLTDAKKVVIEQAKKSASDYAGSYVESDLQVSNNQITKEQIRVLSAGYLEILSSDYKRAVNSSGSVVIDATARIKMDKSSIRDGLAKLKSDPERKAKIKHLENDNQRLRSELFQLTKTINSTDQSRTDLMVAREAILADLDSNRAAAKQVFEAGTLFQLAMIDDQDFELAKKDIEDNVFGYMIHETKITLGKPKFTKNEAGMYDIAVPVEWNAPMAPVKSILSKHFIMNERPAKNGHMGDKIPYSVSFNSWQNSKDKQRFQYTEKLSDFVRDNDVSIKVSAGNYNGYLVIGTITGGMSTPDYALQFSNDSKTNIMVTSQMRNPIIIRNIPEASLKKITSLKADVIVEKHSRRRL